MVNIEIEKSQKLINLAKDVLDIETLSIKNLSERIDNKFITAINILYNCKGRVIITGMGKSGIIGKKIAATFSSTGTPSYFLHPAESTHGDSGVVTREDIIIAISNSGETSELLQLLPLVKRFDIKLIALTGKTNSTLAQKADVTLDISVEKEACPLGLAPTASTTATLAMGDALAVCLLDKKGITSEDFLLFHPSGALGKGLLYRINDLMISGDKLPIVRSDSYFKDAILEVSSKKLGMTIVIDENFKTAGIMTDGDIRRALLKNSDIDTLLVKDVMTPNPITIDKNELAAKALQIMEKYSITSIVVNDSDTSLIGIVHIHDLLKAGVAWYMENLKSQAKKIKLVAFDVDGVLTNGDIIYTDKGDEIKIFNAKDGQGMNMLRTNGIITAIITARRSPVVERRAQDLGIAHVFQGIKNKIQAMQELLAIYNFDISEVAYVGDDIPDICVLEKVGLACCPLDAVSEVKKICHFISEKQGGKGAVREISDFILAIKKETITLSST